MKITLNGKSFWVNYHHLYCFYVTANEGSISAASEKLGIGSPALSIQIKQLESSLNANLFERSHRKLLLNETGKIVFSYAKEIFRLGEEMIETLNDRPSSQRIHLQVGALDTIPKHLTIELVQKALQSAKCSVSVLEGKTEVLLAELTQHRIDLMLSNHVPVTAAPGQIYVKQIARLPLWVVGGRNFVKLKKNFPKSLEGQPFVVPTTESRVRHEFESFCKKAGVSIDIIGEAQDLMIQKLLSIKQVGLTVAPEFAVREYLSHKDLFLIGKLPDVYEELFMISASRKIENPVASLMMKSFIID